MFDLFSRVLRRFNGYLIIQFIFTLIKLNILPRSKLFEMFLYEDCNLFIILVVKIYFIE